MNGKEYNVIVSGVSFCLLVLMILLASLLQ